jgi:hypothetical protein
MATEPQIDPDDPFGFNDNPMAVREFLDAHNAINTPWFRIRFFFALWRESISDWFWYLLRGETGAEVAGNGDSDQDAGAVGCINRPFAHATSGSDEKSPSETQHSRGQRAMPSFLEQLPALLRQLAEPTTPHTAKELWCRIASEEWEHSAPTLLHELRTGENDVKRLVLSIVCEQAKIVRSTPIQPFLIEIERLLADDDRLVRMAAVGAVRELVEHGREVDAASPSVLASLRRIGSHDELPLAREALLTLLEMDDDAVRVVASLLRGRPK